MQNFNISRPVDENNTNPLGAFIDSIAAVTLVHLHTNTSTQLLRQGDDTRVATSEGSSKNAYNQAVRRN